MAGKPENTSNIGQQAAIQDPEDALKTTEGVYHDSVQDIPIEDRMQIRTSPQAPDKQPFANLRGGSGSR